MESKHRTRTVILRVRRATVHISPTSEQPLYTAGRGEQGGKEKKSNVDQMLPYEGV